MRFDGIVKTWNDDRGFGFIQPNQGGQDIFVHIKSFPSGTGRPAPDLRVSFEVETSSDGKKRAKNVQFARTAKPVAAKFSKTSTKWGLGSLIALGLFAIALPIVILVRGLSPYLGIAYLVMSVVCGLAYMLDKSAAQNGQWRTSEATLLTLGLLGGWPGAIVAQQTLRHKSSKMSFRVMFWITVLVNVGGFIAITNPSFRA